MLTIIVVFAFFSVLMITETLASHMTIQNGYFNRIIRDNTRSKWDMYEDGESSDLTDIWNSKNKRFDDELDSRLQYLEDIRMRMLFKGHPPDILDRADHITQYLDDMFVNTDSEITHLEAEEPADLPFQVKDEKDLFFEEITNERDGPHSDWIRSTWT